MEARSLERAKLAAMLRNGAFIRLWAAQFLAITAVYALSLAGAALVEEQTHSSAQTGLVILSAILPAFLGSLVAGPVVDYWQRRRVIVASYLARTLVALAFWAGTRFLPLELALVTVYAVNVTGAVFSQFAMSAELALLPELVDPPYLLTANALLQISMLIAEGLGIVVLSPILIKLSGPPAVGLAGVVLALSGVILVAGLPEPPAVIRRAKTTNTFWTNLTSDLRAGWLTIGQDRLLSTVAIQATVAATLLLVLLSLVPGLMNRHLGLSVEDAPLLILPGGLGFVLGTVLMNRWEKRLSRQGWIATGLTLLGLSLGLLSILSGSAGNLSLILVLILGMGLSLALVVISARVVLQERPPAEMRGRVISAQLALANAAAVIPLLLGGSLADRLGIQLVMGLLGLLALGAGALGLHRIRS